MWHELWNCLFGRQWSVWFVIVQQMYLCISPALTLVADSRLQLSLVHEQISKWLNIDASECTLAKRVRINVDYDIVDTHQTLDTCTHVMAVCIIHVNSKTLNISVSSQTWSPVTMW